MGIITSFYRGGNWDSERLSGFHKPSSGTGTFLLAVVLSAFFCYLAETSRRSFAPLCQSGKASWKNRGIRPGLREV